ncbi:MAG TPA: CRISPR-associated helicase Cas3', partial [Acidobacteriota bacterium]|nr:CRISPR-associated helicase Cas3' [Acidobacteriota bacterium]
MHLLKDHLLGTSNIAQSFAFDDYTKKVFRLSGLLHDFGKYQEAFQQYLINGGKRGSVPHSEFGAGYARIINLLDISFAIDGHHKGIPDKSTWQADTDSYKNNDSEGFNSLRGTYFEDMQFTKIDFFVESHAYKSFERELFIRLIFSALTDADWLDTESHFQPDVSLDRVNQTLQVDRLIEKLEAEFDGKSKEGEINRLRNLARTETLNHTGEPCGFYSLNLPTGLGKTLTSMIWALNHAKQNRLKRIFVVLPYINIIDQTAKVFKSIFGEEAVLEHHSNYNENDDTADAGEAIIDSVEKSKRLACENWDYPVIVTTTVQFFESLFSNRPARCRKVHNIAESVVIFDEVQTLPKESVLPTLNMLKNMQAVMRTSFLFCTATQPAFEKQEMFNGIKMIHPLISNPEELFEKTRRVDYCLFENLSPVNYDVLMDAVIKNSTSVLIIFNTKKATRDFYLLASESAGNWDKTYQLSTAMCPAHRKSVIESIRDDLKYGLKILVSSTQLIEAGVDFDFPCVFRALAPLEGIIQAAGRCNREGNMPARGKVYIFQPEDGGMPDKTYRACAEHA